MGHGCRRGATGSVVPATVHIVLAAPQGLVIVVVEPALPSQTQRGAQRVHPARVHGASQVDGHRRPEPRVAAVHSVEFRARGDDQAEQKLAEILRPHRFG